jgi:hypothetical protein
MKSIRQTHVKEEKKKCIVCNTFAAASAAATLSLSTSATITHFLQEFS